MARSFRRIWRTLGGGLLMSALVACAAPVLPSAGGPPTQPPLPTRVAPTARVEPPTAASAAPAQPTEGPEPTVAAQPAQPPANAIDWPGAGWQTLSSGDFNGDGEKEVVYFTPGDVQPQVTFYDAYLSSEARLVGQAMIAQGYGDEARILLAIDQRGIHAEGVSLASFGADATGPAGFLLALDPGSSTFVNLLPLDAAGQHRGQEIGINWNQNDQAYRISPPAR